MIEEVSLAEKIQYQATGRRKTSVARVRLLPGKGEILINKKSLEEYFPIISLREQVYQALKAVKADGRYDIIATIQGGGNSGQAGALRHGLSRALALISDDNRRVLKQYGFLTRDSRMKERKKYGQKGARKRFQFSKR